ncbi:MAG TPA: hypothetical protein VGQ57_22060, partial [Polyangiaceae bacterium]|nr:hypothetical protein [Polyangiaceae bacterium]
MRHGLALISLFFGGILFGTASCGQDEATGGTGGGSNKTAYCEPCDASSDCASGNVCKGSANATVGVCAKSADTQCCTSGNNCHTGLTNTIGAGGSGGSGVINNGGKGGSGGTGGGVTRQSHLGQKCVSDSDCVDSALTCLTSLSDGTSIAKGICTLACTPGTTDCVDQYDNSFCFQFNTTDNYCIEGCTTGPDSVPKCHERPELACSLIGTISTGSACTSNGDCGSNQLCNPKDSQCGNIVTGCVPMCAGDFDCGANEHCDFGNGTCTKTAPKGLPIGAECVPPTGTAADPCQGFCDPGSDSKQGICEALCTFSQTLAGCGWDGATKDPDNVCLFGTILSPNGLGEGD